MALKANNRHLEIISSITTTINRSDNTRRHARPCAARHPRPAGDRLGGDLPVRGGRRRRDEAPGRSDPVREGQDHQVPPVRAGDHDPRPGQDLLQRHLAVPARRRRHGHDHDRAGQREGQSHRRHRALLGRRLSSGTTRASCWASAPSSASPSRTTACSRRSRTRATTWRASSTSRRTRC